MAGVGSTGFQEKKRERRHVAGKACSWSHACVPLLSSPAGGLLRVCVHACVCVCVCVGKIRVRRREEFVIS